MKKLLGVALLSALVVGPVKADPPPSQLCSNAGGWVCVDATFTISGNQLYMDVYNANAANASRLFGLALFNVPAATFVNAYYYNDWTGGAGTLTNFSTWGPTGPFVTAVIAASPSGNNGGGGGISTCAGGGGDYMTCNSNNVNVGGVDFVRFVWALTGGADWTIAQVNALDWGFRALSTNADGEGSVWCASTAAVGSEHFCDDTPDNPQEVVPEPATMTLLATGLAGLAAARRRRKNNA